MALTLSSGQHTLYLSGRTRGVLLDRWVVFRDGQVARDVWTDLDAEPTFAESITTAEPAVTTTGGGSASTTATTTATTTTDGSAPSTTPTTPAVPMTVELPPVQAVDAPRVASPALFRVNSGGDAFEDSLGQMWSADTAFFVGGRVFQVDSTINGVEAKDQTLYHSERNGKAAGWVEKGSFR